MLISHTPGSQVVAPDFTDEANRLSKFKLHACGRPVTKQQRLDFNMALPSLCFFFNYTILLSISHKTLICTQKYYASYQDDRL